MKLSEVKNAVDSLLSEVGDIEIDANIRCSSDSFTVNDIILSRVLYVDGQAKTYQMNVSLKRKSQEVYQGLNR